ncbi:hypothetical protein ABL78_8509 [Leptomonas seymouri]|uniref:Uncharacterized protein n=1 Tax=Leptomonas seymouri TaxID=5684 RepID=A0A0N1HQZ0_LEPSE|nr:hypothetical protein ABL78_8509 [Leptomonas seymouri]|eukprot:KPI82481.1 hypothetical protein ABL78_8509 [Leptomonas seymouri]
MGPMCVLIYIDVFGGPPTHVKEAPDMGEMCTDSRVCECGGKQQRRPGQWRVWVRHGGPCARTLATSAAVPPARVPPRFIFLRFIIFLFCCSAPVAVPLLCVWGLGGVPCGSPPSVPAFKGRVLVAAPNSIYVGGGRCGVPRDVVTPVLAPGYLCERSTDVPPPHALPTSACVCFHSAPAYTFV